MPCLASIVPLVTRGMGTEKEERTIKMTLRLKLAVAALAMLVVALMLPTAAYADPSSLTFTLNVANISGVTSPYAQAVFTFDSGHLDVTVSGLNGSTLFGNCSSSTGLGGCMFGFNSTNAGLILGGLNPNIQPPRPVDELQLP